jgi:nitrite reductase/ring-hydroxylating ferredoxin subunit
LHRPRHERGRIRYVSVAIQFVLFSEKGRSLTDWRALPFAPASGTRLCANGDVFEGQGKEIVFGEGKDAFRIVLFRLGERVLAYHNCCPHFSLPLNYEPELFHILEGGVLMCAHHTAMFHLEDGECFDGPCMGARLTPIRLAPEMDDWFVVA